MTLLERTRQALSKSRSAFSEAVHAIGGRDRLDDADLQHLEDALILADIGPVTTDRIIADLKRVGNGESKTIQGAIKKIIFDMLPDQRIDLKRVILIVGVNGTGKTTTCAKLASMFSAGGEKTTLIAADTFRAAAREQLTVWANSMGVNIYHDETMVEPAAIIHRGISAGLRNDDERIVVDTAGRMHTAGHLLDELSKIYRVTAKLNRDITVLQVLDATQGQTAHRQVQQFASALPIDGFILTKMDGSAKGGVVIPLMLDSGLPVAYIGVGEGVNDLLPFDREAYVDGLISL